MSRRTRISSLTPVSRRSGVMVKVTKSETRTVVPVTCWMNLTSSPSTRPVRKAATIHSSGPAAAA